MSAPQYASLTAGMLARKGEAKPSHEPMFGSIPWQPPVVPAPALPPIPPPAPVHLSVEASTPAWVQPAASIADVGAIDLARAKVRLNDVSQAWAAPKPVHTVEAPEADASGWVPNRPQAQLQLASLGAAFKTTIRLTHAQARAVKLAALILDKPQQEILTAGLIERLEALACADLAKCSCFRAVIEGIKTPEPTAAHTQEFLPPV